MSNTFSDYMGHFNLKVSVHYHYKLCVSSEAGLLRILTVDKDTWVKMSHHHVKLLIAVKVYPSLLFAVILDFIA